MRIITVSSCMRCPFVDGDCLEQQYCTLQPIPISTLLRGLKPVNSTTVDDGCPLKQTFLSKIWRIVTCKWHWVAKIID